MITLSPSHLQEFVGLAIELALMGGFAGAAVFYLVFDAIPAAYRAWRIRRLRRARDQGNPS